MAIELDISKYKKLVLIDDESSTLDRLRLLSINIEIQYYDSFEKYLAAYKPNGNEFYFVDYSFRNSTYNGIEIVKKIGADRCVLISNNFDGPQLQIDCDKFGISFLPKDFLENFEIRM